MNRRVNAKARDNFDATWDKLISILENYNINIQSRNKETGIIRSYIRGLAHWQVEKWVKGNCTILDCNYDMRLTIEIEPWEKPFSKSHSRVSIFAQFHKNKVESGGIAGNQFDISTSSGRPSSLMPMDSLPPPPLRKPTHASTGELENSLIRAIRGELIDKRSK